MSESKKINSDFKIGILGGGQLGKMLCLAAQSWDVRTEVLDKDLSFPAAGVCNEFVSGDFKNYDDVYQFGKDKDVITIEIEHVNTEALKQLMEEGKRVHPNPYQLDIIKDKLRQKQFYEKHGIPTSPFRSFEHHSEIVQAIKAGNLGFPFVQKTRTAGYDGRGVAVIKNDSELTGKLLDGPSMVEPMVDIDKELSVIVARNEAGSISAFPPVEMEFNPEANLVEWVISPAIISEEICQKATHIALNTIKAFDICGLLAVELFLTRQGEVLINEVAPRPHNSGHHTIDCALTSQYQQHLRAILNWPLGNTQNMSRALMVNLLGAPGYTGNAIYEGIDKCLALDGVKLHLYSKKSTKPFRKMGHITILDQDLERAKEKANFIKEHLIIKA